MDINPVGTDHQCDNVELGRPEPVEEYRFCPEEALVEADRPLHIIDGDGNVVDSPHWHCSGAPFSVIGNVNSATGPGCASTLRRGWVLLG
jgi:hypothetical protein